MELMNYPFEYSYLKTCNIHGKLSINGLIKSGTRNNQQQYKCKECVKTIRHRHYVSNKVNIYQKTRKYKLQNKEKMNKLNKKYRNEKKEKSKISISENVLTTRMFNRAKNKLVNLFLDINRILMHENK